MKNRTSVFILSFLIVLLFGEVQVMAQSGYVTGTVHDKELGDKLFGVNVYLKQDSAIGTSSDIYGKFSLTLKPGKYDLVFSFTGMKLKTIPIQIIENETTTVQAEMEDASIEFSEFLISSTRFERKTEELIVSTETIKPALLESKNTTQIETALNQVPGVVMLDEEPQIRGGSGFTFGVGSKVGVMIDNVSIITGEAGKPDWNLVPIENLKHVEIIKGPSSVLTGANAMNGAIFFNTQYAGLKPETKIQVFVGGYTDPQYPEMKWWNGFSAISGVSFLHSRKFGNQKSNDIVISGVVNVSKSYIGPPLQTVSTLDTTIISEDDMKNQKFRLNVNYKHRSNKVKGLSYGINGNIMRNNHSLVMAWYDDSTNFFRGYPGTVFIRKQTSFYMDPFIDFYSSEDTKHHLSARVLYNDVNVKNNENQSTNSTSLFGVYEFNKKVKKIAGLEVVLGTSVMKTYSNSLLYQASGSPKNSVFNFSVYGEATQKIGKSLTIVAGLRGEHYSINDSIDYNKPIFRGGLNYKLFKATFVRGSFGQGYRFPSIAEKYISSSFGSFGVFSNPGLKPEEGWNAEIGIKQGFRLGNIEGYFDGSGFIQGYENTVEYLFGFWSPDYEPAPAGFKFVNTGKSRVTGLEVSTAGKAKVSQNSKINFIVGYTYVLPIALEPDLIFAEDYTPGKPSFYSYNSTSVNPTNKILKYRFQHTFKFDVEYLFKKFNVGVSGRYFSKVENVDKAIFDFEEFTRNIGGDFPPVMYENYFYNHNMGRLVLDFRIGLELGEHQKVSAIVSNLLNSTYSLRPLKAEAMRSVLIQYVMKF